MTLYTSRPKPRAARQAWDKFAQASGVEPLDVMFGYSSYYGRNVWTAAIQEPQGVVQTWAWSNGWFRAEMVIAGRALSW